ncbi:MAG: hypothetical protein HY782_14585 [Chloroflexi bacterium]|nr:hypothetical protein [Chloroflexota bacterium]
MHTQVEFRIAPEKAAIQDQIYAAQSFAKRNRREAFDALNLIFRAGVPPAPPLDGRYRGELIALDVAPGLTQFAETMAGRWMPWQGKTFDAARGTGDNLFTRDSLALAHVYWPLYRAYVDDTPQTYRAFAFRTYLGPGKSDPDRTVLKIDYDLAANPKATIRRVLDELVQIAGDLYLGKAHLHWWWGRWQTVAYFTLNKK